MHSERTARTTAATYLPDWAALILINLCSFTVVGALVALSVAFDAFIFDLR